MSDMTTPYKANDSRVVRFIRNGNYEEYLADTTGHEEVYNIIKEIPAGSIILTWENGLCHVYKTIYRNDEIHEIPSDNISLGLLRPRDVKFIIENKDYVKEFINVWAIEEMNREKVAEFLYKYDNR